MKIIYLDRELTNNEKELFNNLHGCIALSDTKIKLDTNSYHLETLILDQIALNDSLNDYIDISNDLYDIVENGVVNGDLEIFRNELSGLIGETNNVKELDVILRRLIENVL